MPSKRKKVIYPYVDHEQYKCDCGCGNEKTIFMNGIRADYSITRCGIVHSYKRGKKRVLAYNTITGGYKICALRVGCKRIDILVHRLVATQFMENTQNKKQINHIDGVKTNNHIENLEWVTQSENTKHAYKIGLMKRYHADCYNASFSDLQVLQIRKLIKDNVKQRTIAEMFGVKEGIISMLKHKRTYKTVLDEPEGTWIDVNTLPKNPYE